MALFLKRSGGTLCTLPLALSSRALLSLSQCLGQGLPVLSRYRGPGHTHPCSSLFPTNTPLSLSWCLGQLGPACLPH